LYFSAYDSRCGNGYIYCLFRSGIDGSNPELLGNAIAPGEETLHPSASPDGSKVAFVTSAQQIKIFDYTTKTVSAWSVDGNYPVWSPDGTTIVYEEPYAGPLHLMNADGTNQRLINPPNQHYSEWPPVWSPDSKWLIAVNFNGTMDLIEVATGNVIPIGNGPGYITMSWR
jgi:Tol biopolymer transport system component